MNRSTTSTIPMPNVTSSSTNMKVPNMSTMQHMDEATRGGGGEKVKTVEKMMGNNLGNMHAMDLS